MKFSKESMQRRADGDNVTDEIVGHRRWSVDHRIVFEHDGRFYESRYSVGATEMQDESPYEYEGDEIECDEVFPVEKMVTVYERAPA